MNSKIKIAIDIQNRDGKPIVYHTIEENNPTMKDIALACYKLDQIKLELLDRIWDNGGEGYEIYEED